MNDKKRVRLSEKKLRSDQFPSSASPSYLFFAYLYDLRPFVGLPLLPLCVPFQVLTFSV